MKTAISIPDGTFARAERLAKRLKVSRSELFTRAVAEFIDAHEDESVTKKLDEVYAKEDSRLPVSWSRAQAKAIGNEEW